MKIRSSFVSNSSSSSFLIYGTFIEDYKFDELNVKESDLKKSGLEVISTPGDDDKYIGLSWDATEDNETRLEFKDRVKNLIISSLGKDMPLATYSEAWYDG